MIDELYALTGENQPILSRNIMSDPITDVERVINANERRAQDEGKM